MLATDIAEEKLAPLADALTWPSQTPVDRCLHRTGRRGTGAAVIPVPSGVRVWLAVGRTDMRKGMNGLAL